MKMWAHEILTQPMRKEILSVKHSSLGFNKSETRLLFPYIMPFWRNSSRKLTEMEWINKIIIPMCFAVWTLTFCRSLLKCYFISGAFTLLAFPNPLVLPCFSTQHLLHSDIFYSLLAYLFIVCLPCLL